MKRVYRYLISANITNLLVTFYMIFFMWKIAKSLESAFYVGIIPVLDSIALLLSPLPQGFLIDKFRKTPLLISSNLGIVIILAILYFSTSLVTIYVAGFSLAFFSFFSLSVSNAFAKDNVVKGQMLKYSAYSNIAYSGSSLIGNGAGAILTYMSTSDGILILIGISLSSLLLSVSRRESMPERHFSQDIKKSTSTREILAVVKAIAPVLLVELILNGTTSSVDVFEASYVALTLKGTSLDYTLFVVGFPIGKIVASTFVLKYEAFCGRFGGIIVPVISGLAILVLSFDSLAATLIAISLIIGFLTPIIAIPVITKLRNLIPKEMFGRVSSISNVIRNGPSPVFYGSYSYTSLYFPIPVILRFVGIVMIIFSPLSQKILGKFYNNSQEQQ